MPTEFVNKIGGLDQRRAEDSVPPSNAVEAQYLDPFRAESGEMAGAYGFKTVTPDVSHEPNWEPLGGWERVIGAFKLGPYEILITGMQITGSPHYQNINYWYIEHKKDWNYWEEPKLHHIHTDAPYAMHFVYENTEIVPSKIIVDSQTPIVQRERDIIAGQRYVYYQAIIYGHNLAPDNIEQSPVRVVLCLRIETAGIEGESYTPFFSIIRANFHGFPTAFTPFEAYHFDGTESGFENNAYYYFIIFEDVWGNYITHGDPTNVEVQFQIYHHGLEAGNRFALTLPDTSGRHTRIGIHKVHIYRTNATLAIADHGWDDESDYDWELIMDSARWKKTLESSVGDLPPLATGWGDSDGSEAESADLIYPGIKERLNWMCNISKAKTCIGKHNDAFWISKGNEVFFSEYHLDAPYGVRPLNFPTVHRWAFNDIGNITELASLGDKLIVFGESGIATLSGTYLTNFVEKRISSVGSRMGRGIFAEYINPVTVIDDKAYFISKEGKPYVTDGYEVAEVPGVLIPYKGSVYTYAGKEDYYIYDPIDSMKYRRGWLISNGTTMFLYDPQTNRWVEWPREVNYFFANSDPYYENEIIDVQGEVATEYEYLRYLGKGTAPEVYATDGTYQTAVWKTPKIIFPTDQKFTLLILHWRYNSDLPYGEQDIDSIARAAQVPIGTLSVYLDDKQAAIKSYSINLTQSSDGEYRFARMLSMRGRKFAFQLSMTAAKYWHLTGWELKHSPVSRKSYA